jgi:AraC family transcriptional regulator
MSVQESILQAIDLFEARLHEPVRVAEAAEAAGYSLYHFCRLFNQAARLTPYEYLMRRRLSQAAQELLHSRRKVLDIALDYQFGSSEAFGRAFQRMFALLPSRFRARGHVDARRMLPRFSSAYLAALEGLRPRPAKVRRPAIELAGWMAPCSPAGTLFIPLWQRVSAEIRQAGHTDSSHSQRAEISARHGLLFYPHDWHAQGCFCFAGVPAEETRDIPVWLGKICVQEQEYACFTCESLEAHLHFIVAHLFHSWLPHSGLHELPDTVHFENLGPSSWLIYLPAGKQ